MQKRLNFHQFCDNLIKVESSTKPVFAAARPYATKEAGIITLDNTLLRDIGSISRIIQFTSDKAFKRFKLQKGQFMFLTRVRENPGINLAQLSNILHVDKTTATKAVQKLIAQNYLSRQDDPTDGRSVRLYPTTLGIETYDKILAHENAYLGTCFKGLSPQESTQLNILIRRAAANLEESWQSLK